MKSSIVMEEIRRIRDANSLRHLSQTPDEFYKEMDDSVAWFTDALSNREDCIVRAPVHCLNGAIFLKVNSHFFKFPKISYIKSVRFCILFAYIQMLDEKASLQKGGKQCLVIKTMLITSRA